ncbi:MAG: plastocyanin/azurin family copper-binding protein [Polaromonas sp.]|jgi:uncharacterized cupredoxin-like copper-binding protein
MKTLFTLKLIAVSLCIYWSTASFAHENTPHKTTSSAAAKEQKDWGIAGDAKSVQRTITLTMGDNMRFTPDKLEVKQGDTIRFVVKNQGKQLHEMVIGTKKELDEHAAMMARFPTMAHDEPYMAHVAAGKSQNLIWTFNRPGEFEFACLIAGHYRAGMVGKITVLASR